MPSIDFSSSPHSPARSPRRSLKWALGICAAVAVVLLGSTLASNINLNGGGNVEFGQGRAQATACDSSIMVTPQSSFVNSPSTSSGTFERVVGASNYQTFEVTDKSGLFVGQKIGSPALGNYDVISSITETTSTDTSDLYSDFPSPTEVYLVNFTGPGSYRGPTQETMTFMGGGFYFTSISVTDISSECDGKPFTIKAYRNGSNTPLDLYQTNGSANYNSIVVLDNAGDFSLSNAGLRPDDIHNISTGFMVELKTAGPPPSVPLALATDVNRITIESGSTGSNIYSDSLLSGQPSWITTDVSADNGGHLTYGFDGDGMWFQGNANDIGPAFPYRTQFTIPANQKVVVQMDIVHAYFCSDQAVAIFPDGTNPYFFWHPSNQDALVLAINCPVPELYGPLDSNSNSDDTILTNFGTYHLTLTYDPNAPVDKFVVVTKDSSGGVLDTRSISDHLVSGNAYRIGFSADSDGGAFGSGSNPPSYFKNLSIKVGN